MRLPSYILLVLAFVLPSSLAAAAEIPPAYRGYFDASTRAPDAPGCRKGDANENTASIGRREVRFWESVCKVRSVRRGFRNNLSFRATCTGEGSAWRIEGALSIAKVRGRDGVLMTRKFLKSGRTGSNFFERCT